MENLHDIDGVSNKLLFKPWLPHNELQGKHQWLIMLWKRGVLTLEQMTALFNAVISTHELPYVSDCESDFSITSTGSIRRRVPSKEQKALATFATAFLRGEKPQKSECRFGSLLKIVQNFKKEFEEPEFIAKIREELERLSA